MADDIEQSSLERVKQFPVPEGQTPEQFSAWLEEVGTHSNLRAHVREREWKASAKGRELEFYVRVRERRNRLQEILGNEQEPWPPPRELVPWLEYRPRIAPSRADVRCVLKKRRRGKGFHAIANETKLHWRHVQWICDFFGDLL